MLDSRLRAVATLAVTGALLLGAVACADDTDEPDDTSDDAVTEESDNAFTLYSGRNENLIAPLIEQFETDTGIEVDVRYGDTAQMAAQLLDEGDRTPAHVFLAQDAGALGAVAKAGLFAPLDAELLDRVPAQYRASSGEWVGVTGRSRVLVYNPDLVSEDELPSSVFELTEPQWEGRIGVAPTNASFQAFVTALRIEHGEDAAEEWLAGLVANDPQIREGNGQILTDVDEGRLDAGLVNHYYLFQQANEAGVTVDEMTAVNYTFPGGDTGALVNISGVGLLAAGADDPDAQAFIDYLLSEVGQAYFVENTAEYPMLATVTDVPVGLEPLAELQAPDIDLNDLDTLEETVAMITNSGLV